MDNPTDLSEEEWTSWMLSPVTKAFRSMMARMLESHKEQWANGAIPRMEENWAAVGSCRTLKNLLTVELDQVNKGMNDEPDTPIGPRPGE